MEHKIVVIEPFKVVGMEYVGRNENAEIAAMWGVFNEREKEIDTPFNDVMYGVCYDCDNTGSFGYIAGMKVEKIEKIPNGMKVRQVEGGKYALFTFKDHISKIGEFFGKIYNEYLPELKLNPDNRSCFEFYDHRFCQNGECDLYIPIF